MSSLLFQTLTIGEELDVSDVASQLVRRFVDAAFLKTDVRPEDEARVDVSGQTHNPSLPLQTEIRSLPCSRSSCEPRVETD